MEAPVQTELTNVWTPQAGPQWDLLTCPCFEIFFGGARGGGKTDGMLGDWASHADLYGQNAIGLMVRRTRTELMETIERSKALYGPLGWKFHDQDKMWRSPAGARLRFAYLERDQDAEAYQGHSYTRIYIEEIGNFPSPKPVMKLMATLRSGAGVPVGFRATGNPGGPGHMWVRERYIDPDPRGYKVIQSEFKNPFDDSIVSRDRVFIPSRVTDNKYLGAEYIAQLQMSGSAELVRAWLEGDWSAIEGAFFDKWSARNIVAPFEIPDDWARFRSMDWGYAAPFSVGWWAVAGDDRGVIPRGSIVRYREWYGCTGTPNEGLRLTAEQVGSGIALREAGERLKYGVLDPAAFNQDGGPSIAERINQALHGAGCVGFHRADNTRVGKRGALSGWDQMRARITGDDIGPRLFVFDDCRDFLRTVPVLQHDPDRPEDLDTETEDHCFVGCTLVETDKGQRRIDSLPVTGKVLTVSGEYVPYRSARLTRQAASIVRLTFDNGVVITCTPDHRFLVDSDEWRYASDLENRSVLCRQPSYLKRYKSLLASGIISAARISRKRASDCIGLFGKPITAPSLIHAISTTRTATRATIESKTSNAYPLWITWEAGTGQRPGSAGEKVLTRRRSRPVPGTAAKMADDGIRRIMKSIFGRYTSALLQRFVSSAGLNIKQKPSGKLQLNIATKIAKRVRCVSVERLSERADVYCLTVPSTGCFAIEGGLIVSNCADEVRYGCSSRPWIPRVIAPPKPDRLIYEAKPDGRVVSNMSIMDMVKAAERRRKREASN